MMHDLFKSIGSTVKGLEKKGTSLWEDLVNFSVTVEGDRDTLDKAIKVQKKHVLIEMKVEVDKNSTFRSAHSVILAARQYDVKVVEADGKVRGKTAVEKECKALAEDAKEAKPAIDKFKSTMNTANALADKLEAKDCVIAAALVQDLLAKLVAMVKPAEVPATGTNG